MTWGLCSICMLNGRAAAASPERLKRTLVDILARMQAPHLGALMLILLIPGLARAQDVFSGGDASTTYSDQFSSSCEQGEPPNVFKQVGMNPLVCHGQSGPQDSQKQCSYAGMRMIAHIGETCYYCAPIVPPINGIIIPFDQVRNATNQGFRCGADQVDPNCMAICSKPGSLKYTSPGPNGDVPVPVPAGEGPPSGGGLMPGPAGGIGYRPGANPCLPQGPGGYDYCQNGPGARLPAGCSCTVTVTKQPPPGSKGITHEPAPPPSRTDEPTRPNIPAFEKAMAKCLDANVSYKIPQSVSPAYLQMAREMAPKADRNVPFAQLSPISQIFVEETAMALQTQAVHDTLYGGNPYNTQDSTDYLVGWIERCLVTAGLRPLTDDSSPNNPLKLYALYLGVAPNNIQDHYFFVGYGTFGMPPPPLKPPQPPSILPGLLPLKTTP